MPKPLRTYDEKLKYSRALEQSFRDEIADLTTRLKVGEIGLGEWQVEMRSLMRRDYALQLITASGGDKANVDPNDWLVLGNMLQSQYRYLEGFANEIKAGLDESLLEGRAMMYGSASKEAFWTQLTQDTDLPAMPGDGSTQCLTNCGCEWQNNDGAYSWVLGKTDNCQDCSDRAAIWNPYNPESV